MWIEINFFDFITKAKDMRIDFFGKKENQIIVEQYPYKKLKIEVVNGEIKFFQGE